jgi:hypothetical protein
LREAVVDTRVGSLLENSKHQEADEETGRGECEPDPAAASFPRAWTRSVGIVCGRDVVGVGTRL